MHTVIGIGNCKIVYLNCTNAQNVDELFQRLIQTYTIMLDLGYPTPKSWFGNNRLVFTDNHLLCQDANLCIGFHKMPLGVYTDKNAYHKQIAKRISFETGLPVFTEDHTSHDICIGIGNESNMLENYMILKESLLKLPPIISC